MSLYRCAFLFCRALAFFLFASAIIDGLFSVLTLFMVFVMKSGVSGASVLGAITYGAAGWLVFTFSKGISAALVGQNVLEGEAIQASNAVTPQERMLIQATGGLLLLIPALIGVTNSVFAGFSLFQSRTPFSPWTFLALPFAAATVKALVGFYFAFRASLKRALSPSS